MYEDMLKKIKEQSEKELKDWQTEAPSPKEIAKDKMLGLLVAFMFIAPPVVTIILIPFVMKDFKKEYIDTLGAGNIVAGVIIMTLWFILSEKYNRKTDKVSMNVFAIAVVLVGIGIQLKILLLIPASAILIFIWWKVSKK